MHYMGGRDGKIENLKKEGKLNISNFILFYTINLATLNVYTKFEDPESTDRVCLQVGARDL